MSSTMTDETSSTEKKISHDLTKLITSKDAKNLAINAFGPNVEIVDYAINSYSDEKIGYLGSHNRLVITTKLRDDEDRLFSTSFFVKSLPYDVPKQAEYIREKGVFDQEANFFKNVVPELADGFDVEAWAPECHVIKNDCLVFEDLRRSGFSMTRKLLDENEIKSGLSAIARLHGASLNAETRLGRRLNVVFPTAFEERAFVDRGNQYRWYAAGVDVAVKIAQNLHLDAANIDEACKRVFAAMKPSIFKRNVVSHGDLWSNNLMFDDSRPTRCRIVDFQLVRYSPLGHDVAQFLHLCASKNFRDHRTEEMIDFYYKKLVDCLKRSSKYSVEIPSLGEVKTAYEEQRLGAVVTAVMYFPTVLMDGHLGAKIMNDSDSYEKFVMCDRRDIVVENMKRDVNYRQRIEGIVRELVDLSHRLDELPVPC